MREQKNVTLEYFRYNISDRNAHAQLLSFTLPLIKLDSFESCEDSIILYLKQELASLLAAYIHIPVDILCDAGWEWDVNRLQVRVPEQYLWLVVHFFIPINKNDNQPRSAKCCGLSIIKQEPYVKSISNISAKNLSIFYDIKTQRLDYQKVLLSVAYGHISSEIGFTIRHFSLGDIEQTLYVLTEEDVYPLGQDKQYKDKRREDFFSQDRKKIAGGFILELD